MEDFRKALTTKIRDFKKNQSEVKNAITKVRNRLVMNTMLEEAEK